MADDNHASLELSKELHQLTGWDDCVWYYDAEGDMALRGDALAMHRTDNTPAYSLGYLTNKALETGHVHVKIKQGKKGVIVTAPPCYHIEAKTPADGVAQLLIQSAGRKFVLNKSKKVEA